jgi:hypothetical protein
LKGKRKMKKLIIYKTLIFVLAIVIIAPFIGFAADTWNETPELNHEPGIGAVASEPVILKHVNPAVELLAETPDLLAGNEENDAPVHESSKTANVFSPKQYVETPAF